MRYRYVYLMILCGLPGAAFAAADRFFGFNDTTATDFTGVFLAPEGTARWGPNEALNEKDRRWDSGERLPIKTVSRGRYDLKIVDSAGHTCVKHGLDLTRDTTFDVRDEDLSRCKP